MTIALLAKVKSILDKLGKNGTGPEEPTVPSTIKKSNLETDRYVNNYNLVHEYCVADYISSYAKKRRENALKKVKEAFSGDIIAVPGASASKTLHNLTVTLSVKSSSKTLDASLLAANLRAKGWSQSDIDALVENSKKENKAPETWSISSAE